MYAWIYMAQLYKTPLAAMTNYADKSISWWDLFSQISSNVG